MNDYLTTGRRQEFWEEPFTRRVMDAIKSKELEMKTAAEILGVSYGTLYGRYRDSYGCLKHPYRYWSLHFKHNNYLTIYINTFNTHFYIIFIDKFIYILLFIHGFIFRYNIIINKKRQYLFIERCEYIFGSHKYVNQKSN